MKEMILEKKSPCGQVYVEMELCLDCIFDGYVNGYNSLQIINDSTFSQLQEHFNNHFDGNFQHLLWFQDGTPAHRLRAVRHRLHEMFASGVVASYHKVEWPPRSLDLTPCDFFLWG